MTSTSDTRQITDAPPRPSDAVQRLRNVLRGNAVFSAVTGLASVAAFGPIARLLGVGEHRLVLAVGIGLLAFALDVFGVSGLRWSSMRSHAAVVIVADAAWVVATVALVFTDWVSTTGKVVLGLVALVVAEFAVAQFRARAAATAVGPDPADEQSPPLETWATTATIDGPSDIVWATVIDHELYGRIAPNLGSAVAITGDGPGLVRECTDTRGRAWRESCTVWVPGHRYAVEVDTSPDDYPYPVRRMVGEWWVAPVDADTSTVGLRFTYQPTPTIRGRLFAAGMQVAARPIVRRIVAAWRSEVAA